MFAIKLFGANDVRLVECEILKSRRKKFWSRHVLLQFADQIFV
ncbi:MAG: hypothetical protein ACLSD7_01170 [Coprococcus phoceensis]